MYIQFTFYQVPSFLIEGDRRYSFQTPHLSARPASVVHYLSAVYIESKPGEGTVFQVRLPIATAYADVAVDSGDRSPVMAGT